MINTKLEPSNMRGWLDVELESPDGTVRRKQFHNAVSDNLVAAAAAALAQQSTGIPYQIKIGTGALAGTDIASVSTHAVHNQVGPLAQFFTQDLSENTSIAYIMLALKRVGTAAATITIKVYSVSTGTLMGETLSVSFNGISSSAFDWRVFEFATPITLTPGAYRLEVITTGYTYSAGVTELQVGVISGNPYAGGYIAYYTGTAWAYVSGDVNLDAAFRVVIQTHDQLTAITGVLDTEVLSGYSRSGRYVARFVSIFGISGSDQFIGHASLEDSDGTLLAVATVQIDKAASETLRIYWSTEVVP